MPSSAGWTVEMPDACGQRSEMGEQEGFELDMEGTCRSWVDGKECSGYPRCGKE